MLIVTRRPRLPTRVEEARSSISVERFTSMRASASTPALLPRAAMTLPPRRLPANTPELQTPLPKSMILLPALMTDTTAGAPVVEPTSPEKSLTSDRKINCFDN